jgi:hypothetical protein
MLKLYSGESLEKFSDSGYSSAESKQKASEFLKKFGPTMYDILETRSLVVGLKGLEYMNGKHSVVQL